MEAIARQILSYDLSSWTYYAIAPGRRPIMSPFEWRLVLLFAAVTVVPFLLGFFFALGERFAAWGFGREEEAQ